jgi:hypothetical protein
MKERESVKNIYVKTQNKKQKRERILFSKCGEVFKKP